MKHCIKKSQGAKLLGTCLLLSLSYFAGAGAAASLHTSSQTEPSVLAASTASSEQNWGLGFPKNGGKPTGNASAAELRNYRAAFLDETEEPVIYLTFDCGYENGNTPVILDALKKHQAPATFFVVGNYLETSPDLVRRMVEEGHIVANHTYHHPNMSQIATVESFQKELKEVETLYQEIIGSPMVSYYRPPQGKYSSQNLQMAKDLGYHTFFWSLAYVDWLQDSQPSKEEAFDKLLSRIHSGAVVLLHNTSSTNAAILDELLSKWEEMDYHFAPLSDLAGKLD